MNSWKTSEPPKDRKIWLQANRILNGEPFEGAAFWGGNVWYDKNNLVLAFPPDDLHVLQWMELEDRASGCPENELVVSSGVHFIKMDCYEGEMDGFYAFARVWHGPTWMNFLDDSAGPFASRNAAVHALHEMLTTPIDTGRIAA